MSQDTITDKANDIIAEVGVVKWAQCALTMLDERKGLSASAVGSLRTALTRIQTSQYGDGLHPKTFAEVVAYGQGFVSARKAKWTLVELLAQAADRLREVH